jgi:hypothetical protein
MLLNFEPENISVSTRDLPFMALAVYGTIFFPFCMNDSQRVGAKWHFVLQKAMFTVFVPPTTNL